MDMEVYTRRAVESDVLAHVDAALSRPLTPLSIALLTGSPQHGVAAVLAHGVVPRLIEQSHRDASRRPVQLRGAWEEPDANAGTVHYCLSESDVPEDPPPPESSVRVLLVTCTDVSALPEWLTDDLVSAVRTLPIGPLTLFEAHDYVEAQLGGPVDPESAHTLASVSGFAPTPLSVILQECRSSGALERLDGVWTLMGDPVQAAVVPYLRAQLASVDPAYARIMFRLALTDPFSLQGLTAEEASVVDQLLREGELHRRADGLVEFLAPAAARALRSVAPADEQHRVHTTALEGDEPALPSVLWAIRHGHAVPSGHLERALETAVSERNWSVALEIAESADDVGRDELPPAMVCRLHLHAGSAARFQTDADAARSHLDRAEDVLSGVTTEDASSLRTQVDILRAELRHFHAGDLEAAVEILHTDPVAGADTGTADEAQRLSHLFLHHVYGGKHMEAENLADVERRTLNRASRSLRDRVAVADVLLRTAAGAPVTALRKAMQLATRRSGARTDAALLDEELRSATVIATLASDGPNAYPLLERRLGEVTGPRHGHNLANTYRMRGSWEYARGSIQAAHRFGELAISSSVSADPWGVSAAAVALVAETAALRGDHASARRCIDRLAEEPLRASAAVSGTVLSHLFASQLLLETPHTGELLRQRAAQFVEQKQFGFASDVLYTGVRFGRIRAARDLHALTDHLEGGLHRMRVAQATALLTDDPVALCAVAEQLRDAGLNLYAAEAEAQVLRMPAAPASLRDRATSRIATLVSEGSLVGHTMLRTPDAPVGGARLTPREREVSQLIHSGLRNAEIADRLNLSLATVEGHITRIYRKTGASRRAPARR